MPQLKMSHFEYCILFSILTSIVLGVISNRTDGERVRYALQCFAYFMLTVFGLSWLMYLGHG